MACGNATGNAFLYDLVAHKVRHRLFGHLHDVCSILFSPDGALISGSDDGSIRIWDARDGPITHDLPLRGRNAPNVPAAQSRAARCGNCARYSDLVAQRPDRSRHSAVRRPPRITPLATRRSRSSPMEPVWPSQGRMMSFGFGILPANRSPPVWPAIGAGARLWRSALPPLACWLLVARTTRFCCGDCRAPIRLKPVVLEGHTGDVTCLAITSDGALVVSGSLDGTVRVWNTVGGELAANWKTDQGQVHSLALTPDGNLLITGGQAGSLRVWDFRNHKLLATPPPRVRLSGPITQVAIAPTDKQRQRSMAKCSLYTSLAAAARCDCRRKWGESFPWLSHQVARAWRMGFDDRTIRLYDVVSGQLHGELSGHSHPVVALSFNGDGTLLASSSRGQFRWDRNGEVKLWEAPSPGKATP